MTRLLRVLAAGALLAALQACGETPRQFNPLPSALGNIRGVAIGFENLPPLDPGLAAYAAWMNLENRDVIRLGTFNVNADGRPVTLSGGEVIDRFTAGENLFSAVSMLITVAGGGVVGDRPNAAPILQGPFLEGVAELSVPAPLFLDQASGSYRVFTPTDGPDTNENSGVWTIGDDDVTPTLLLPPSNGVYAYEHYMIINGQEVTMGRFDLSTQPDFINFFSGPEPAPAVPGEDFLINAPAGVTFPTDLSGARVIITLEPIFDDVIGSSPLVILEATLPQGLVGGERVTLVNVSNNFPTGTAAIY